MHGVKIDMGFKMIEYSPKSEFSTWLRSGEATKLTADGKFRVPQEGRNPWAKVLIRTDDDGNVKILDEYQGQKVGAFKAESPDPLVFYVYLDGKELPIDGLKLKIDSIDSQLNWIGQLTASGSYRLKNDRHFEAYIPIKASDSSLIFVVLEGTVDKDRISLIGANLGLTVESYQKTLKTAN